MVDAARGVLVEKALDRRGVSKRIKKFDLCVGKFDEYNGDAVIRFVLRRAYLCAQRAAVLL